MALGCAIVPCENFPELLLCFAQLNAALDTRWCSRYCGRAWRRAWPDMCPPAIHGAINIPAGIHQADEIVSIPLQRHARKSWLKERRLVTKLNLKVKSLRQTLQRKRSKFALWCRVQRARHTTPKAPFQGDPANGNDVGMPVDGWPCLSSPIWHCCWF